jgi:predicted porin
MKKTLVAVAALAASAAFAQSSVTLYGVADAYFGSEKAGAAPVAGGLVPVASATNTVVNDGGLSQSRLGVSVKEDLGAGLSAFAVIEGAVGLDNGAGGLNANRKSVVGLSGGFGAVSLGQQFTPARDAIEGVIDAQSNSAFSAVGSSVAGNAVVAGTGYNPGAGAFQDAYTNSIRYDSPNFDGFSGAVQMGLGENKGTVVNGRANGADRGYSLNAKYENGPVGVVLAYQNDKSNWRFLPTIAGASTTNKLTALGGYYDFGPAKLNLGYARGTNDTTILPVAGPNTFFGATARTMNVGVTVPVDAFTFVAQYATSKVSSVAPVARTFGSSKSFALEARYALSKRTTAYAGYNNTRNNVSVGLPAPSQKSNRFGVGMRHVF